MGAMEGQISFSNMSITSDNGGGDREWRRLRFEAGKSYRIKFIDNNVEMRHRHYNPIEGTNKKGYYRCLGHTGYCPVCAAAANGFGGDGKYKLRKAQETFGANVLVYDTDANGNPTNPLNAEVYFWGFNAKKFVALRSIQQDWGDITQLDLKLTCPDAQAAQFQDVSITNLPNCLYLSDPTFKAQCDAKIDKDRYPLAKMLCREVSLPDMVAAFGLPQSYLPQDMQAQMPQNQQTVTDYANGIHPQVAVQPQPVNEQLPFAGNAAQAPVQQVYQQTPQYQQVPPVAPMAQPIPQPVAQPQPVPTATVQPVQQATIAPQAGQVAVQTGQPAPQAQAPADAYADLDALQNILG